MIRILLASALLAVPLTTERHWIMGTFWEIETPNDPGHPAVQGAFSRIREIDALLSHYRSDSPISQLNREGRAELPLEAIGLIERCLVYNQESGGAFDLTIAPLIRLWGFSDFEPRIPTPEQIATARSQVGMSHLRLTKRLVTLPPGMALDFGAIGKGYALDEAAHELRKTGVRRARLDAGGQQMVIGEWEIGIQHPRADGLIGRVRLADASISTSGDYERGFVHEGRRYSHIVDPRTGWPAEGYPSVTVVAPSAEHADALSTIGAILGPEAGPLMTRFHATALWVRDNGQWVATPGFPWSAPVGPGAP